MNTSNVNIMSLLLGSVPLAGEPVVGSDILMPEGLPVAKPTAARFDVVLDQLLAPVMGMELEQPTDTNSPELCDKPLDLLGIDWKQDKIGQPLLDSVNAEMINDSNEIIDTEDSVCRLPVQETIPNTLLINSETPLKQIPQQLEVPFGETVPMTIDPDESQLLSGKLEVQSWFIEGKTLHLEVAQPDQSNKIVLISIPVDQLTVSNNSMAGYSLSVTGQSRVLPEGTQQQNLSELLSRYDIKELHIDQSVKSPDKPAMLMQDQEVGIKIVAQNMGQELVIKANLSRHALRGTDTKRAGHAKQALLETALFGDNQETHTPTRGVTQQSTMSVRSGLTNNMPQFGNFTKPDMLQMTGNAETTSSNATGVVDETSQMLPDFMRSTSELTLPQEKVDLQPVKFNIPENLRTWLKPNGQSIRLNIEPEHLGPARLSLHIHNNQLRAVVVVENTQAKMTVEGSLDHLMDALNKADIQVDRIEVNVDQQNAREQLFQQRAYTNWRSNNIRPFSITDNLKEIAEQTPPVPRMEPSYVSAGRVNLLA
ncbi:MAG: hypothetical protein DRP47_00550 [Candidatus Zixiibacteriota bacterium]|nr:MAG: hypothetical protein DRP47_00550 [candidate division Zixibacteria bacterium]